MQNRIATMVALIAAIFGALLSLFTTINWFIDLVRLGIQPARLAFQFLASNDWIGYGLILFFALILLSPKAGRLGGIGVVAGALINLFFAANSLASILVNPSTRQVLEKFILIYYSRPVLALLTLCFGIAWTIDPPGRAARVFALVLGMGIGLNMVVQLLLYPFRLLTVAGILVTVPVALWFLLHFVQGQPGQQPEG